MHGKQTRDRIPCGHGKKWSSTTVVAIYIYMMLLHQGKARRNPDECKPKDGKSKLMIEMGVARGSKANNEGSRRRRRWMK